MNNLVHIPSPPAVNRNVGGSVVLLIMAAVLMMFFAAGGFNAIATSNQGNLKGNLTNAFNVTNNYHGASNGRGAFDFPQIFGSLFPVILVIYVFRRRK